MTNAKPRQAAPCGARQGPAKALPSLGYRTPPTRWHAAGDLAIGLAFWCGFFALASHYLGLVG
ncbi:hypothetical protein [Falsiroseomonas oryziterrae]|uniref:hypothetical protein n=1 Tax=Falsiroseomonas oryziterrae TaxID=2911368 RepID=UPI001F3828DA|nr:hypothetical protein [Roseomonas sp. NPKOSM-4]